MTDVPYGTWGLNHQYYCAPGDCISACMHAGKKLFKLKSKGYKDGVKTQETR